MSAIIASPYSRFAADYDATIGLPFFVQTRDAFEKLIRAYCIKFKRAADIGCGTGRFASYLNRRWKVPVVGVDLSPEMLDVAAKNCRGSRVSLLRQDIRSLHLPRRVDLMTCNFDTLNHLTGDSDLMKALRSVNRNLVLGGHFIFDVVMQCSPISGADHYVRRFFSPHGVLSQEVRWRPGCKFLSIVVSISSRNAQRTIIEAHKERAYSAAEVGSALMKSGFTILGIHDAATLARVRDCKPRIIVVVRKRTA